MDSWWSSEDSLFLAFVVCRAHRLAPSFPPGHEMIRCQGLAKQFLGIAFEFSENLRGELMVLLAERRDPGREGERSPVDQMIREAYEFFSLAWADFGLLTS